MWVTDGLEGDKMTVLETSREGACWGGQAQDRRERSRRAALELQRGGSGVQGLTGGGGGGGLVCKLRQVCFFI